MLVRKFLAAAREFSNLAAGAASEQRFSEDPPRFFA